MKKCAFLTLGCKVNQYETQAIRESLMANGFVETDAGKTADIYVINTCTVTSASDEKSRQHIRKLKRKNPCATIVVTGCYAEADAEAIKQIDGVNYVITMNEKSHIAEIVRQVEKTGSSPGILTEKEILPLQPSEPEERNTATGNNKDPKPHENSMYDLKISRFTGHTRAFLKIEDGCDMFCSYCIIPYVRGNIKSRPWKDIDEEARRLIQNGYKEIVLTGIHLGAYGRDKRNGHQLLTVLERLSKIPGMERLRLSSLEVNEITPDIISFVANTENVCPHFHIPLQSGDESILKMMNRKYTPGQYLKTLENICSKIDLPSFTTDVMVGFPGETDTQFGNTIDLCKKAGFSRIHIFPFSVRKGTVAAKMPDQCDPQTIKQRKNRLKKIANTLAWEYKKKFLKKRTKVLVETERDARTYKLCGYSERYIKVLFDGSFQNAVFGDYFMHKPY